MKIDRNKLIINLLLVFIVSLFTPQFIVSNIIFALISVLVLINKNIVEKLKSFFKNPLAYLLISFYLIHLISLIYSENLNQAFIVLERRFPLLFFPIIIFLIDFKKEDIRKILRFTAYTTAVAALVGLIYNTYIYFFKIQDAGYFYNDNLVSILGFQAVYFAIYVNFAIFILLNELTKNSDNSRPSIKAVFLKFINIFTIVFLIIINFLLASRTSMVLLFLMLFVFMAYYVIKQKKYLLGVISIASVMVLFAALILFFPKTINRFESIKNMKFNFENTNTINHFNMEVDSANWNGLTTRLAIWQCTSQSISENILIGSGVGDYKDDLHEKFKENNFYFGLEKEFETHNNYLHVILMFGLIGFIVFLIYLFLPLILAIRNQDFIYIAFLVIFIFSFLTEDALSRNQGIMLFALFNSIFAFNLKLNKSN